MQFISYLWVAYVKHSALRTQKFAKWMARSYPVFHCQQCLIRMKIMSTLCHLDAGINTNFILKMYYFFIHCNHRRRNSNTHKSGSTTSLHWAPRSKSSLSVDFKKRGKGWAYWLSKNDLGWACTRNQLRKTPVEEGRGIGVCHLLSSKIKISLCASWKTPFKSRLILESGCTPFCSPRLQAPLKLLFVGIWIWLVLFWCAQWWPLTKTRRMTQWL